MMEIIYLCNVLQTLSGTSHMYPHQTHPRCNEYTINLLDLGYQLNNQPFETLKTVTHHKSETLETNLLATEYHTVLP